MAAIISGCSNGIQCDLGHTILGTIADLSNCIKRTFLGEINGCSNGFKDGSSHTFSGTIRKFDSKKGVFD